MIKRIPIPLFALGLLVIACAPIAKYDYTNFMEHHPRSIVVVPPFNKTTAVDAPVVYETTVTAPLAERGYYVFPVFLTQAILLDLGVTDEGLLATVPPDKFKEVFGADAVLYVTIESWSTQYVVLASSVTVKAEYKLVDTSTGETLWEREHQTVYSSGGGGGGGVAGLVAMAINAAVTAATVDYRPLARQMNLEAVSTGPKGWGLPAGPYHPEYQKDYPTYAP